MAASSACCWCASTSCWFIHVAELLAVPGLLAFAPAAAVVAACEGGGGDTWQPIRESAQNVPKE